MLVKNIIKNTAQLLSVGDVCDGLNTDFVNVDEQTKEELDLLVMAVNIVNNNIASNYLELIGKTKVENSGEILSFDSISSNSIIEIKKVFCDKKIVDFKVLPEGLKVKTGMLDIIYSYFPKEVCLDDEINHYTKINELIFAQGVAGEYLFLKGAIEDAYMWDKKFKQSLINLLRPKRNYIMPARGWY